MGKRRNPELYENITSDDVSNLLDKWIIGMHAERNKQIAKRNLIDGICFEPLAEEYKLSVRQVKNIVYKCEDKILSKIRL